MRIALITPVPFVKMMYSSERMRGKDGSVVVESEIGLGRNIVTPSHIGHGPLHPPDLASYSPESLGVECIS